MNTDFLNLILTDKSETAMTFLEWRTIMNGTDGNSNMQLIDGAISRLNTAIGGKADGFSFDPESGVLQLTSGGKPIAGASVTINLNNYYTKQEVDEILQELEDSFADNETIQNILQSAVGNLEWDEESRALTMYNINGEQVGDTITIEGGGGGGGGGTDYSVRIVNGMPSSTFTVATSSRTVLKATFYEYYGSDSTGVAGTLEVTYKLSTDEEWKTFALTNSAVAQGEQFSVDVTDILTLDKTTSIKFTVTGGESEVKRSLTYNITLVEASISDVNFDTSAVYTGNIDFQYRCVGRNLKKTVYFYIDGSLYKSVDVGTSHNATLTETIEMTGKYSYGAHDLKVYFETEDGARSNVLLYTILYNDSSSTDPMIGLICEQEEITYGDTISIKYVVYTPNQETTDELVIKVYHYEDSEVRHDDFTQTLTAIPNNQLSTWQGTTYPESGEVHIEFTSGNTVKEVVVTVNEIQSEYDLEQVSTNLVYSYNAAGRSNNDSGKEVYECPYRTANGVSTKIKGLFEGFNWVSNGYVDGESLTLSGTAKHTIKLPIFSTSYRDDDGQDVNLESAGGATVTTNGRTFEIDFVMNNVTDINAKVVQCMSEDHAGFVITPQVCYLLSSNGTDVELDDTGFILNEESIAAAYIKDGTRIRLSFVIEAMGTVRYQDDQGQPATGQCVDIYINGQYANSFIYPDNARFNSTEFITIGDNSCITNVYEVRIYNRGLSATEILQNYKASPLSVQDRISRFEDNDVLTDDGDVDYYKAINKYNCLLITGKLSPYKGANGIAMSGKTESGLILTKPNGEGGYTTEFSLMDKDDAGNWVSSNNVQGTSSVKFPVKNYKVYLARNKADGGGTEKVKYSLKGKGEDGNDLSIPESTLCWKGDYMSSDHANTFNANLADTLYQDKTEAQMKEPRVQNTVYGFRCLLFQRDDEYSTIRLVGDGCLNNDKGNSKTFGLENDSDDGNNTKCQKWEFLNNTEAICSFKSDNFNGGDGTKNVEKALESTYPDQGDLEDEGLTPNYDYIQALFTWVCQRANFWEASEDPLPVQKTYNGVRYSTERDYRKAIFINEFEKHFDKNHTLVYYLFMEFVALCDNRAKNMFMQSMDVTKEKLVKADGGQDMNISEAINPDGSVNADMIDWEKSTFAVWMPVLYDLDSCFGVENSGYLQIPYFADWNYQLKGTQKFNGAESVLWLMVEEAFANDIQKLAGDLTDKSAGNGGLNYESLYDYHIRNNALLVCPAVINRDMEVKYQSPWVDGFKDYSQESAPTRHMPDYKYLQRGSRTQQKDAFIFRRCNMLYSKYKCNKFLNNNINFRCGTSGGLPAVDSGITITANQTLYPAVKFGDGDAVVVSAAKTNGGTPVTIIKPGAGDADKVGFSDTVYIEGGTMLTDIGDISKFYPYELQLQNATGLKKLTLGSSVNDYNNPNLKAIDTSGCRILEELNIQGCTGLGTVNLSRNGIIRKILAENSSATSIQLPNGGVLETLHLGKVTDIVILNHTHMSDFACDGYDNLTTLRVENTPNVPTMKIVAERLARLTGGLRLVGIDEKVEDTSVFELLLSDAAKGKYIDNNGAMTGTGEDYPFISGKVHCNAIGTYMKEQMEKVYPNLTIEADSVIQQFVVKFVNWDRKVLDTQYVLRGSDAVDPTTRQNNPIPTPTRPSTDSTNYTFDGWEGDYTKVSSDMEIMARYSETVRTYTVRWYNGESLLQTDENIQYGSGVEYRGDTPEDTSLDEFLTYRLFDGWDKNAGFVNGDLDIRAKFTESTAPTDKQLKDMTPTELYALVKQGVLDPTGSRNNIITSGDEFDLIMGKDYDFDNIESTEIVKVGETKTFNGDTTINTNIKLFDEDKPFTIAIDFEFTDTGEDNTLLGCFGRNGIRLQQRSGNPVVRLGVSSNVQVATGMNRELVVIRKKYNDNNIYVYACDKMNEAIKEFTIENTLPITSEAPLSVGGVVQSDGYVDSYGKGKVYWAKVWMSDLGDSVCKNLVSWTRETITMRATGDSSRSDGHTFRLFHRVDNSRFVNCCFLMKELLDKTHQMNGSNVNAGGWRDSYMRRWLNNRVYNGLPDQWRLLIQKVQVMSSAGNMSQSIVTSEDYIWIPSCKEVGFNINTVPYSDESEGTINYFTNDPSRIKHLGGSQGAANYWWLRSPYIGNTTNFYFVTTAGSYNGGNIASNSYGVCFGFCI